MPEASSESTQPSSLWDIVSFVIAAIIAVPLIWYYCFYTPPVFVSKEHIDKTMGTDYIVKAAQFPESADWQKTVSEIQHRLDALDQMMSTYKQDSEVCRFNAFASTEDWFPVSIETAEVVQIALEISQSTEGAFDITAAPLVQLWGFGNARQTRQTRTYEELRIAAQQCKERIGYGKLTVRLNPPALKKSNPELSIDLSAIAKGFAADNIAKLLDGQNITDYLIEIGGEVRSKGKKNKSKDWIVGIEKPMPEFTELYKSLPLRDQSLATSGNYLQRLKIEGKEFSHIIDPRTGLATEVGSSINELVSVSVLAPDCTSADAWATALFVLGTQKGIELAEKQGLAALFLQQNGGEIIEVTTKSWNHQNPTWSQ